MPLSRAEIQKRYREKKKSESGSYAKKERDRKRKAYVSVALLSETEAKKRRKEVLKRVKKHNEKKREEINEFLNKETVQTRTKDNGHLTIKLDFNKKRCSKVGKIVMSNEYEKAEKQIKDLETLNAHLKKEKKRIQKRLERARKNNSKTPEQTQRKINTSETISNDEQTRSDTPGKGPVNTTRILTPNTKANMDLRDSGLTPKRHTYLKKKLLQFHVLTEEIKSTDARKNCKLMIARKYRCARAFGKILGISRKLKKTSEQNKKESRSKILKRKVHEFLQREDNCVTMPGKRDQKQKHQKRILTDYLHNLHAKFILENPDTKISRSTFSYLRPKHVLLVNFCSRNTCLCSRHQNIALKIKAIQIVAGTKNPDKFILTNTDEDIQDKLRQLDESHVTFTEWKRVDESGKIRWKQVQTKVTKAAFVEMFTKDVKEFRAHVDRVKNQYSQMRHRRENLQDGHVLIWMDFAENFTCAALDEVQSAYWTSEQVTLHTSVAYFPKTHDRTHKSIVGISDLNIHNAAMVVSMVSSLIPIIKSEYPGLKHVHYLTDSPTSQYRNKSIFEFLTRHEAVLGVSGSWDYLESGHGKGPCDGLGGSVKRSADMAVKQGKVVIQNAKDFYSWATNQSESETSVAYYYVSQEMYETAAEDLKTRNENIKAVKGTFKLHAVVPIGGTAIASRDLSCSCESCRLDVMKSDCGGWTVHELSKTDNKTRQKAKGSRKVTESKGSSVVENSPQNVNTNVHSNETVNKCVHVEEGDFCAAVFEQDWYIGLVSGSNESDDKYKISFMEEVGTRDISFRWPTKADIAWIPAEDILMKVPEPHSSGSRKRLYKLGNEITDLIEELCERRVAMFGV